MKVAIGADHEGFELKSEIAAFLGTLGHSVEDLGTFDNKPVDYPDYSEAVGRAVLDGRCERGILVCGSGVGAAVAACKLKGIRASVCHDTYSAHQGVEHDDMNVLTMGSRVVGNKLAFEIVRAYVGAVFSGEERHVRRLAKIRALEEKFSDTEVGKKVSGK
jgi:RpiB/LacA/LacB family sugar-phosphate isomerase